MPNTKEEIILSVLNECTGDFAQLSDNDMRRIAGAISQKLDDVEKSELELKQKTESERALAKLEIAKEICTWQDKLKEIPFYEFSARSEIKFKILELQSKLQYGMCCVNDAEVSTEDVLRKLEKLKG